MAPPHTKSASEPPEWMSPDCKRTPGVAGGRASGPQGRRDKARGFQPRVRGRPPSPKPRRGAGCPSAQEKRHGPPRGKAPFRQGDISRRPFGTSGWVRVPVPGVETPGCIPTALRAWGVCVGRQSSGRWDLRRDTRRWSFARLSWCGNAGSLSPLRTRKKAPRNRPINVIGLQAHYTSLCSGLGRFRRRPGDDIMRPERIVRLFRNDRGLRQATGRACHRIQAPHGRLRGRDRTIGSPGPSPEGPQPRRRPPNLYEKRAPSMRAWERGTIAPTLRTSRSSRSR